MPLYRFFWQVLNKRTALLGVGYFRDWACTISTESATLRPSESSPSSISRTSLAVKPTAKRNAENPHAALDEAGAGVGIHELPRHLLTLPGRESKA